MATVDSYCSVADAAEIIGCTDGRVRQLLRAEVLPGIKLNARAWVVEIDAAKSYADAEQTTGAPRGPRD